MILSNTCTCWVITLIGHGAVVGCMAAFHAAPSHRKAIFVQGYCWAGLTLNGRCLVWAAACMCSYFYQYGLAFWSRKHSDVPHSHLSANVANANMH